MLSLLLKGWNFITTGIMPKVVEWAGIGAAILASVVFIRKTGADSVKLSQANETIKDIGVKNEIISNNSNVDAISELRDKWEQK